MAALGIFVSLDRFAFAACTSHSQKKIADSNRPGAAGLNKLGGVDRLCRGYKSNALRLQALQPLMEITDVSPETMEFRHYDAIKTVLASLVHQFFQSGQVVHGARIPDV